MTRTVPGSGAEIVPVFNSIYGVREVYVNKGGSGYSASNPPRLRIGNCGTPIRDAVLRPIIEGENGEITAVEVLDPGEGYSPLKLVIEDDGGNGGASGNVFLRPDGGIDYITITSFGDSYFDTTARIEGGGGSGAELVPVTGLVTGLSISAAGRNYTENDVNIVISGGGGDGATGVASVNPFGEVESINLTNTGEFFETPPLIQIIGGGGSGATAEAFIDLGRITTINLLSKGGGYTSDPQVIFTRDTDLIRTARNRQSLNSVLFNLTGLTKDVGAADNVVNVETTDAFTGSGKFLIGREIVRYTGKTEGSFTGCTRGTNFRFDQKVILDPLQNDADTGLTNYEFRVTDRVRRVVENSNNRVAIVYDWDRPTRSLYLTFEVDELAFIDGGRSNEKAKIIAFVAGAAAASGTGVAPHVLLEAEGENIIAFTDPPSQILNRKFEDNDELDGAGDGIIDLVNTGTEFENQINLDGGIASSRYGIEETLGGQNTTLLQVGDQIYDGSAQPLVAYVETAGALGDGDTHQSSADIVIEYSSQSLFNVPGAGGDAEVVEGLTSGVTATTVSRVTGPKTGQFTLSVKSLVNDDTTYKFSPGETLRGNTSGAQAVVKSVAYTSYLRNEDA